MEVLSGPWANFALLIRQTITSTGDNILFLWLLALLLFVSVCLLLLQLIIYFSWKLRQAEADLSNYPQDRSAIYRNTQDTHLRRRSVGLNSHT